MKLDFLLDENNTKYRIFIFICPLFITTFHMRFLHKMTAYVKGKNLAMSTLSQCGGKHHRNIISAKQNSSYFHVMSLITVLDNALIIILQLYGEKMGKEAQFFIHNLISVFIVNVFFSLYVPWKHIIESRDCLPALWCNNTGKKDSIFYVRRPSLTPRRYHDYTCQGRSNINHPEDICRKVKINIHSKCFRSKGSFDITPVCI